MGLVQEITDLTNRIRTEFNSVRAAIAALPSGGGSDPWTRVGLASDFVNTAVTFSTITGFSFTPAANTNFTVEAELLVQTGATASLPRVGVSVGAGQAYGSVDIEYQSSAAAKVFTQGQFNTAAVNVQQPVGTAPLQANPYLVKLLIKGRSGATPGAIAIQLAAETAATDTRVRIGSEFRRRTNP